MNLRFLKFWCSKDTDKLTTVKFYCCSVYKLFQNVGAGKGCRKPSNIYSVKQNGIHIEDPTEIANTFDKFFVNIAARIKEQVTFSNHEKLKDICCQKTSRLALAIQKKIKY